MGSRVSTIIRAGDIDGKVSSVTLRTLLWEGLLYIEFSLVLLRPCELAMVAFWNPLRGTSFSWFKDPVIRRLRMPIEAVKATFENVLKKAVSLPAHDEIPLHRLEVAIRRVDGPAGNPLCWHSDAPQLAGVRDNFIALRGSFVATAFFLDV